MHRLLYEIQEQPAILQGLLDRESAHIAEVAERIRARGVRSVLIAARGTSDNAGVYAKYLWGALAGLPVMLATPSLYTLYGRPPRLSDTLVVGLSQSGMSPDVVAVLQDGRRQGMLTVAITNNAASPLAQTAEWVIDCRAGEERSVAATKSYTAELMCIALLGAHLAGDAESLAALQQAPAAVAGALTLEPLLAARAERYRYMRDCAVVARGFNYCNAFEVALKVKELTYCGATPYSSADFRHGPFAVVEPGYPVIAIAPGGVAQEDMSTLLGDLRAREADLAVISDCAELMAGAQLPLHLPVALPEWLSPLATIVPGQLLAYHLAVAKGLDPQQPRGLRKVTETR